MNFTSYIDGILRLSARDEEFCKLPITARDIRDVMTSYTNEKSTDPDGLPFEFYLHIPDLFEDLLANVCHDWHQNGNIVSAVNRSVLLLLRTRGPVR